MREIVRRLQAESIWSAHEVWEEDEGIWRGSVAAAKQSRATAVIPSQQGFSGAGSWNGCSSWGSGGG